MSGAKILIVGLPNTGKTTLLKTLKNALVVSRDGKPFPLQLLHFNVPDYDKIEEVIALLDEKLDAYKAKYKAYPETIVFDSVSRIFTDIESSCSRRFNGFDIWKNINKEIDYFLSSLATLQENNFNLILISHAKWDENARKYIETCKGSFRDTGGFLSTVDYALNIDIVGNKRIITHRGTNLARTLIEDMPDKEDASTFNLQNYLEKVKAQADTVTEEWSI